MGSIVSKFTRRNMWSVITVVSIIALLLLFQLVMVWFKPYRFSIHIYSLSSIDDGVSDGLSMMVIFISFLLLSMLVIQAHKASKIKIITKSMFRDLSIVVFIFCLFIILPTSLPINFIIPIIFLFWFVVNLF